MRYSKGSLVLNPRRDLPILSRVVSTRFIAHSQLFEFLRLGFAERDRQVFNWRMRRLVRHGLLQTRSIPYLAPEPIYSITRAGALALESHGELPFASWGYERSASDLQVPHALELNNIELALCRGHERFSWMGESQVRCLHIYLPGHFAKVYDAVISVNLGGGDIQFALEYEATQKTFARYDKVRQEIESEQRFETFLYLTPSFDLLRALTRQLSSGRQRILFGLVEEFKHKRWDATIYYADFVSRPLRQVLVAAGVPRQSVLKCS